MHMKNGCKEITKDADGNVNGVILDDGTKLDVSMVIVGTGIEPSTQFLKRTDTGIKLDKTGAIITDVFFETSVKDIFAAGDVASFPFWQSGEQIRIEHWITALEMGQHVAHNMQGKYKTYNKTPFFWSTHYNKTTQYIGHCTDYDEVYLVGEHLAEQ